jgi:hypothetical protein
VTNRARQHVRSAVSAVLVVAACNKNGEEADPEQGGYGQPSSQPTYAQPTSTEPTYTQPTYGQASPQPQPAATATPSQPNAMAFPCQADATCVTHRCNTAVGRCAWPCQTNDDCQPGNQCIAPVCLPAGVAPTQ